mgnify:CR=1 FL=1
MARPNQLMAPATTTVNTPGQGGGAALGAVQHADQGGGGVGVVAQVGGFEHGGFAGQVAEMAAFLNALALPLFDFREQQHLIGELDGTFYRF